MSIVQQIPRYKCHKEVRAFKIGKIEGCTLYPADESLGIAPVTVPPEFIARNPLNQVGYYVRYADGYESFSPAAAFEEGYTLIDVPVDRTQTTLHDGRPVTEDHADIDPATGLQKGYVVLSAEERAKGFVRPLRHTYIHVGHGGPKHPLRDLTDEERQLYASEGYVKYEDFGEEKQGSAIGRFWTQDMLDQATGCQMPTRITSAIAETYARDPHFYSGTYCAQCCKHFPVGADGEFVWQGTNEKVGT